MRQNDIINYRLQNILSFQIPYRCDELTRLINETNYKDLKDAFPTILESIFGFPAGWGLRSTDKNLLGVESEYVLRFLDPLGPLFMLAYQLGTDYFLKYELSLSHLPPKLRRNLEGGIVTSTLFCDKLYYDQQTRRPTALLLSPFELLIFRFALHILPKLQPEVWVDSVYVKLTERYLCHFLPCDPQVSTVLPDVPYISQTQQCSAAPVPTFPHHSPSKPGQNLSLLKPSVAMSFSANSNNNSPSPMASVAHSPLSEIWRTKLIAQVLVQVWLSVEDGNKANSSPQRSAYIEAANSSMLSSAENARMVRILAKHLHYFANSACYTNPTPMDEMKRQILPLSKVQIYRYLVYTMNNWPLDTSFRVILEAWLSYIQPWRYTNLTNYYKQENEESGRPVDKKWQIFVADNLPVYTCIFRLLIERFQRLDLATLKYSIMVHRLTKVFSLANFKEMLSDVEESLTYRQTGSYALSNLSLGASAFGMNDPSEGQIKCQAAASKAIADFLGQDAKYIRLFGNETKALVRSFVEDTLLAARQRAVQLAQEHAQRKSNPGFWSSIFGPFESTVEEYTLEDRNRVTQILHSTSDQFCVIFDITDALTPGTNTLNASSLNNSVASSVLNTSFLGDRVIQAPPMGPLCEGDPDKVPIASTEVAWLVRMFHDISCYFNRQYGLDMQVLYSRQDLYGRLAHQLLQPPCSYFVYERGLEGYKERREKQLPARLSLRPLARRRLIFWVSLFCAVAWLLNFHPVTALFFLALVYVLNISIKSIFN